MGWVDSLEMERLPAPTDQVFPRRHGGGDGWSPQLPHQVRDSAVTATTLSHGSRPPSLPGVSSNNALTASSASGSSMFRVVRRNAVGSGGDALKGQNSAAEVYRVVTAEGIRVRRCADPQSAEVTVVPEGTELVAAEEVHDGNGGVWVRLLAPVEGWIGRKANSLMAVTRDSPTLGGGGGGHSYSGLDRDEGESGEAAEMAMARELEDCMEEEAGTDVYRRDDRLFGSRQGWSLPAGGDSGLRVACGRSGSGGIRGGFVGGRADSRVPGERRARVVGHASVSGCWANSSSMSISATKEKLAGTAATLAVLHCRKILLTILLQCHKEVTQTTVDGRAAADSSFSQRVAALVGARDATATPRVTAPLAKTGADTTALRASPAALRTRAASRQFSSFLQLVLFRGWRPGWWPPTSVDGVDEDWSEFEEGGIAHGERKNAEERPTSGTGGSADDMDELACLDDKEPMSECFRSLPVVLTPLVLSLLRAAAAQRTILAHSGSETVAGLAAGKSGVGVASSGGPRSQPSQRLLSFGAHVEEALLQSVASQLRQATRIGHRDHALASSPDAAAMSDGDCLRQPRLRYVTWASRIVQAGSGSPAVPCRVFHAWAAGLRSPSLPVKQQVCAELSRLLDDAVQAVDRAHQTVRPPVGEQSSAQEDSADNTAIAVAAMRRLKRCVELLPLERLRSVAERRMLKEGEDEPMFSRALQSIVDLVASAELASRVLRERESDVDREGRREQGASDNAATTTSPTNPGSVDVVATGGGGGRDGEVSRAESQSRSVLCFPSPAAYVALQGRDLEPPWTAEFWILRANADGTLEDSGAEDTTPRSDEDDKEGEGSCTIRPLQSGFSASGKHQKPSSPPPPVPRRAVHKSYSERLTASHTPNPPPPMFRVVSTPSSSVDLSKLPPVDSDSGAPVLFRAQSADAVGQHDGSGSFIAHPVDSASVSDAAVIRGGAVEGVQADAGANSREDTFLSLTPAFAPPAPVKAGSAATMASVHPSWYSGRHGMGVSGPAGVDGGRERRGMASRALMAAATGSTMGQDALAGKREMGAEPPQYLASSQAGHIKLQAGGAMMSLPMGRLGEGDGHHGDGKGGKGKEERDSGDEAAHAVHSEALCLSMGMTGEKDRAFDFVVPTGRWVHLAIVMSSPAEARVTLYVEGVVVDTMSLRMSLPMGCLGAGPHAQEVSAVAGSNGGSFVGLMAQVR